MDTSATAAAGVYNKPITPLALPKGYEDHETHSGSWWPSSIWQELQAKRRSLDLPCPGAFEHLHKEVKGTFLTAHLFDGARADITKMLSPNFQVSHTFSLGSAALPSSYMFNSVFMNEKSFLQGTLEMDGSVQARVHHAFSKALTMKCNAQLTSKEEQCMFQGELDYQGDDYSVNFKSINPWIEGTGVFIASYLQSVTKRISLGAECITQKPTVDMEQTQMALVARLKEKDSVATVHLQGMGVAQASYYQRVNEKVEIGAELQMAATKSRREAICTVGAKFDFHQATLRAQMDTTGRVSMLLEEKIFPGFTFTISGDLDHMKGESKFGVGFMLEG
ncbi:mitochondrial import receptor subunit tom40 [Syncephalis plumigaleata]|nr:mitochondrial import receptor subunit tom40 [Syncephalis plumigaleata]